jgi:phage terminase small subunit
LTAGKKPAKPKSTPKLGTKRATPDREALFLEHYIADPERNGTQAAIAAGYSPKSARFAASKLLAKPNIRQHVASADADVAPRLAEAVDRLAFTKEEALARLAVMARRDIRDVVSFGPDKRRFLDKNGVMHETSGVEIKASDELSADAAYCIDEISEGPNGIKLKMVSNRGLIMDFAKLAGWITEKSEQSVPALDRLTDLIRSLTQRSALPVGPRALPSPSQGTE